MHNLRILDGLEPGASNPPLWMGDQPPTSDTMKHTSHCLGLTWRRDLTLCPTWCGYLNVVVRISNVWANK